MKTTTTKILLALTIIALAAWACRAAQVVLGTQMGVSSVQSSVFSPSLTLVQPPTVKTNLFYNIGLIWDADGSALATGFRVRYGTNAAALTNVLNVPPTDTFCTVSNLALKPTWFFQVAATWGTTNVTEFSNTVRVQEPLTNWFTLTAVFPLYSSSNMVNWVTNRIATLVLTNPPGNQFFRSHFRQLDYQWTNNQIKLKPFALP